MRVIGGNGRDHPQAPRHAPMIKKIPVEIQPDPNNLH
jgi:hypothetical protein